MKTFVSATTWRDLTDGHLYHEGEPFPFDGREVAEDRLAALETGRNRAGFRLIKAASAGEESAEGRKEDKAGEVKKGQKTAADAAPEGKPRRTRKKAE